MNKLMRVGSLVLGALALSLASGSCGKVGDGPRPLFDSNTNWLLRCADDVECNGSLRCYCGMCTKPCGQDLECSLLGGAQCAESGEGLCGEQASAGGLCVLACTEDSECGADFNCVEAQCVPTPEPVRLPPLGCTGSGIDRSWDDLFQFINSDLARADADDTPYYRYFALGTGSGDPDSLTDICGAGLELERQGLRKLINSLSIETALEAPVPIDVDERLYRIDLRDYGWERALSVGGVPYEDVWEALIANDAYAIPFSGDDADDAVADTGSDVPVLLAGSFFATATLPHVYYDLLDIPERLDDLLLDELAMDPGDPAVVEAGFVEGGVELLAQTWPLEVRAGFLWMISEFGRGPGALFANPLESPLGERELVFTLPNGLHAFAFMSGDGQRIDNWNSTIHAREPDGVARVPRANLRRHPRNLTLRDEVRDYVDANPDQFGPTNLALIRQRFPGQQELALLVERDYVVFPGTALIQIEADTGRVESIMQGVDAFARPVTLHAAAAELMVAPQDLLDNLDLLDPGLAPLDGGSVERDVFTSLYLATVCVFSAILENQPSFVLCP